MSDTVLYERRGGIAYVTLNRPDRMNSLTGELMRALPERLHEAAADAEVRCVVLSGTGDRAFSAGADLGGRGASSASEEARVPSLEESIDGLQRYQEASWLLHSMPKPTVAAINGAVAGASLSMCAACDFRLAAEHAVLTTAFARIGFTGDFGGSYFITQLVGAAKARELYMLCERIDASEALRMNLVTRVFPSDTFRKEVDAFAQGLAEGPPISYRYMKRNLNRALRSHPLDALDLEAEAMVRSGRSQDHAHAVDAFLNKSKAKFEGR